MYKVDVLEVHMSAFDRSVRLLTDACGFCRPFLNPLGNASSQIPMHTTPRLQYLLHVTNLPACSQITDQDSRCGRRRQAKQLQVWGYSTSIVGRLRT